eukprot:7275845-Prymnesium_polylepis.2
MDMKNASLSLSSQHTSERCTPKAAKPARLAGRPQPPPAAAISPSASKDTLAWRPGFAPNPVMTRAPCSHARQPHALAIAQMSAHKVRRPNGRTIHNRSN